MKNLKLNRAHGADEKNNESVKYDGENYNPDYMT